MGISSDMTRNHKKSTLSDERKDDRGRKAKVSRLSGQGHQQYQAQMIIDSQRCLEVKEAKLLPGFFIEK